MPPLNIPLSPPGARKLSRSPLDDKRKSLDLIRRLQRLEWMPAQIPEVAVL